jgi:hypothetical protein
MKHPIRYFLAFAVLLVVVVSTTPSDDECINQTVCRHAGAGAPLVNAFQAGRIPYKVEHHLVYSTVVNRFTGQDVAIGLLSTVIDLGND